MRHSAEARKIAIDKTGIDLALPKGVGAAEVREERDIAAHTGDQRAVERRREPVERCLTRRRMSDELGDHRVIERADLAARFDTAVEP